jgi:hypothetical protein
MGRPEEQHVRAMRNLLTEARAENSRMVAAAIGGHLSKLTREAGREASQLGQASDTVRDASLDLLKALHHGRDVNGARRIALDSVSTLEAALPSTSSLKPLAPRDLKPRQPSSVGARVSRGFAARKLLNVLPLWRG